MPKSPRTPSHSFALPPARQLPALRRRLLAWFHSHKRSLPWRASRDPYRIWISEIMLQQTRVAAVLPYYQRFLARFPTVRALARAPESSVLEAWAGLGYYSRARNLHRAAKEIVRLHSGKFPRAHVAALALPGVGRYTAAAVLSIAYGASLAVLDGNVARVLARLGAVRGDLRQPARWRLLEAAAQRLLASRSPADWNQAMMELGATVCTPRAPSCPECPVARFCRARALGLQDSIPAKRDKRPPEDVRLAAAVLLDAHRRTLLIQPANGAGEALFSRMWQFPALRVERDPLSELRRHLRDTLGIEPALCVPLPSARHAVTFRRVTLLPFLVTVGQLPGVTGADSAALPLDEVEHWATSSATRKIARAALRGARAG